MANENLLNMAEQKFQSAAEKIAKDLIATCYKEPQTKADRIRAMTDEELAQFLNTRGCPSENQSNCFEMSCKHCWEKWLKQPAE